QHFLENGYQLPGTADGGSTEKSLFGGPLGGATLDDDISNYFAVRLRADIQQASFDKPEQTETTDKAEIVFPNIINLFFAGTATEDISFFFEAEYATREGHDPALAFERSFLLFNNLIAPSAASIKVGVFDPSAFYSFPTHRQQLNPIPPDAHADEFPPEINRMPLLPFAFSSKMFGLTTGPANAGASTGTVTAPAPLVGLEGFESESADDYAILPFEPYLFNAPYQTGISIHGRPFGSSWLYQLGVVQEMTAEDNPEIRWDPYVMLRYDTSLGEYSAFQVSGFYYQASKAARATIAPPPLGGDIVFSQNALDWTRFGIGARWQYKYFDLYGTIIWDEIDKPEFGNAAVDTSVWETDAMGLSLELDWLITQKWLLGLRYDSMETGGLSVLPAAFVTPGDAELNQDATFIGVIGKYYPTPNIGLYARTHFNLESSEQLPANVQGGIEHPARNLTSIITIGVDMAF
ncbi:MAG: hypothetical protein OQL09_00930, partial [Gammaproteobacteria bacterium]|nr:hypothetical protein [Gammaproteobacteria bacterium]